MNQVHRQMVANWKAAGEPYCTVCRQPIMGKRNITLWKKGYHVCPMCSESIDRVKRHSYRSVPPSGIAKEEQQFDKP